jgi:beta-mannosidase
MRQMAQREVIAISEGWQFKEAEKPDSSYLSVAQFPTNVHLDLLHHKLIPDPYIGKNELEVQWVGERVWVYRTAFATPRKAAAAATGSGAGAGAVKAVLAFDGLDTFASVVLNGKTILETENMFIPERVDVTDVLTQENGKDNELVITFDSAYLRGWKLVEKYPDHKWGVWNGDASRLAVRKTQYHWVSSVTAKCMYFLLFTNNYHRAGIGARRLYPAVLGDL